MMNSIYSFTSALEYADMARDTPSEIKHQLKDVMLLILLELAARGQLSTHFHGYCSGDLFYTALFVTANRDTVITPSELSDLPKLHLEMLMQSRKRVTGMVKELSSRIDYLEEELGNRADEESGEEIVVEAVTLGPDEEIDPVDSVGGYESNLPSVNFTAPMVAMVPASLEIGGFCGRINSITQCVNDLGVCELKSALAETQQMIVQLNYECAALINLENSAKFDQFASKHLGAGEILPIPCRNCANCHLYLTAVFLTGNYSGCLGCSYKDNPVLDKYHNWMSLVDLFMLEHPYHLNREEAISQFVSSYGLSQSNPGLELHSLLHYWKWDPVVCALPPHFSGASLRISQLGCDGVLMGWYVIENVDGKKTVRTEIAVRTASGTQRIMNLDFPTLRPLFNMDHYRRNPTERIILTDCLELAYHFTLFPEAAPFQGIWSSWTGDIQHVNWALLTEFGPREIIIYVSRHSSLTDDEHLLNGIRLSSKLEKTIGIRPKVICTI